VDDKIRTGGCFSKRDFNNYYFLKIKRNEQEKKKKKICDTCFRG